MTQTELPRSEKPNALPRDFINHFDITVPVTKLLIPVIAIAPITP